MTNAPKRLTEAQKRVLVTAERDRGIVIGGIDATPNVRLGVCLRLCKLGLLNWKAPASIYEHSHWVLTDAGLSAVATQKNTAAVALGKLGGAAKSERKTAANRANAKRPRLNSLNASGPLPLSGLFELISAASNTGTLHVDVRSGFAERDTLKCMARIRTSYTVTFEIVSDWQPI